MDIIFLADRGGVGKTTLALHVATRMKALGRDVALADLDGTQVGRAWQSEPYVPAYGLDDIQAAMTHADRVWDTPGHPGAERLAALTRQASVMVIPMPIDPASQVTTSRLWRQIDHPNKVIVLSMVPPTSREVVTIRADIEAMGYRVLRTAIRRYSCYTQSWWDGRTIADYPYASADKAWADICALTDELLTVEVPHGVA